MILVLILKRSVIYKQSFTPIYFKKKLKLMIMEISNKEHYTLIGNDIYILIQIEDEHLHANKKLNLISIFSLLKYPKLIFLGEQINKFFLIEKERIQDLFY
ncbi:hypothetical protein [Spiroplasma endosymbiont of Cantharis lateralis]|uniref:hypothetical protein n=1 Tax=Spiroplasma endosymbiont of Cantharis lateralis TaxID=3066277 RepID=UPI00313D60FE